jgi:transcription-repair coupling factor (superfamily II helicase)
VTNSFEKWLTESDKLPEKGSRFVGFDDLAKAIALTALARRTRRPLVVVFPSRAAARNALDNFCQFSGEGRSACAHYLPCIDFDFYRGLLPNPETLCERNVALFHALNDPEGRIFFTTVRSVLQKVVRPDEFLRSVQVLKPNEEIDRDKLILSLHEAGYQAQPSAYDPGVFAVRGGVIDIFCPLYAQPFRLEFFGDYVEEIRFFDPKSQRSADKIEKAFIVPVGQTLLPHGEAFQEASLRIKDRLDHLGVEKIRREEIVEKIANHQSFPELGLLFPLLSKGSASPAEYFPEDAFFLWDGTAQTIALAEDTEIPSLDKNFQLYESQPIPIAEKGELFVDINELKELVDKRADASFENFGSGQACEISLKRAEARLHGAAGQKGTQAVLQGTAQTLKEWMDLGYRVNLVCHTRTHAERFQMLIEPYGVSCLHHMESDDPLSEMLQTDFRQVHLWQGFVSQSQLYPSLGLVVLSEEEVFGHKKRQAKAAAWKSSADPARLLQSFRDLKSGDLVVHKEHGIGRYLGLKSMDVQGIPNDFVVLEYKDGDKLYVPVYRLNVLQKYVGGEGAGSMSVDKLGGDRWVKAKGKARKAVALLAAEFLNMQAKRRLIPAHPFSATGKDYAQFEMEFPFDETPDQMKSINDVMSDLSQGHPMDRLICGDVGYGKTEVAMRAAFRAILDGKQVAVLVPTTVLAFQHFENFKKRFKSSPARIEMVSRLRSNAEVKKTLAELKEGKIDVLIGTHRLLSSDIEFRDLGLVVVDEEHRFGVVHKDRLKKITESVHYLTMTATPIPRTLNMAMSGIKEISVITTPPPDRLSVRTFVSRRTPELIAEAITNELARDGQVFFVHNRIESQAKVAEELQKLFPRVRIEVVHGQMDAEMLEKKMLAFYQGEAKILLTTAIIESGLDIPTANTILIDKADHFGLAQLYQLRGRVGRSERRAYCYLLVENENQITEDAKERLQVIQRYTDLGAGFQVASHDLELRGAGDLLGKDQSGHLTAIGVDYYFELLEDCMREIRGQEKRIEVEPEINLRVPAFFPEPYVPDITERINLYRRLSAVEHEEQIAEAEQEVRDRFGTPPEEVLNLLGLMRIKLYLKRLHVVRMGVGPKRTSLQFASTTPVSPEKIVKLVQDKSKRYSVTPDQKLVFEAPDASWSGQLREIQRLCALLGLDF